MKKKTYIKPCTSVEAVDEISIICMSIHDEEAGFAGVKEEATTDETPQENDRWSTEW